ncbi:hypothetical protein ACP70R_021276 [Stipagrostis hirtigluma subsp. patula]
MSFAGVSFVGGGRPSTTRPVSTTSTVTDSGYHLFVVDGYSRIKEDTPTGEFISSRRFIVGGYWWLIKYYPNGEQSDRADSVSLYLSLDDDRVTETVKAQFKFSFVDRSQTQAPSNIGASKACDFSHRIPWGWGRFMKTKALEKTHVKDDSFTLKCDIVITKDVNTSAATMAPFAMVPASDMHLHFTSLLQSAEGTDVKFEVCREIFVAHSCVLAARSTVFKAKLSGPLKDTTVGVFIRIDDMEAHVFAALLFFIYSDSVPEIEEEEDDVMWQHMLVAACRYDLLRLRLICEQKLCTYINTSTVANILALAEQHQCQGLKNACLDFLNSPANVQEVMVLGGLDQLTSSCPTVLKEVIVKLVARNFEANNGDTAAPAPPFVMLPESDMHKHFAALLQSRERTDVKFEVGDQMFSAHRCVLAARSAVFRAELFGPMKEGATNSVIRVEDMEPQVFKLLLSFIYSDSLPEIEEEREGGDEDDEMEVKSEGEEEDYDMDLNVIWQHLLVAADRYDLQRLRLMCEGKLCGCINVTGVATILALAEQHHCQGLKEACLDLLDSPGILQEVMAAGGLDDLRGSCPSVLIDVIAKLASLKHGN